MKILYILPLSPAPPGRRSGTRKHIYEAKRLLRSNKMRMLLKALIGK